MSGLPVFSAKRDHLTLTLSRIQTKLNKNALSTN